MITPKKCLIRKNMVNKNVNGWTVYFDAKIGRRVSGETGNNLLFLCMTDVHTKAQRSYNMSRIRSKNTKPELIVRSFLHKQGFRFRLHDKKLPGKPDIVLKKYKTVIFVHGCFWHGHKGCKYSHYPKSNRSYWIDKLTKNILRDKKNLKELKKMGYIVIIIWECKLKYKNERILKYIVYKIGK